MLKRILFCAGLLAIVAQASELNPQEYPAESEQSDKILSEEGQPYEEEEESDSEYSDEEESDSEYSDGGGLPDMLVDAVLDGKTKTVKDLLSKNPDLINDKDEDGYTALSWAVLKENKELVNWLVEQGAKPDKYAVAGAAKNNDPELVKWLVEQGAKPDKYAVAGAAENNNIDLVKWLVGQGAKPDSEAVSRAANNSNTELVKWLVGQGAKPDNHAVTDAAVSNNSDLVKWLVEQGAKPDKYAVAGAAENNNIDLVKWLIKDCGAEIDVRAVFYAARNNNLEVVKALVEDCGAEVDNKVLFWVTTHNNIDVGIWRYLLEKNKDPINATLDKDAQLDLPFMYEDEQTVLSNAVAFRNNADIVNELIAHGAKVDFKDLENAVERDKLGVVKLLLEQVPDLINKKTTNGETLLDVASKYGHRELVEFLLGKGALIDSKAISSAIEGGSVGVVKLLLEKAPGLINEKNENGKTPLDVAEYKTSFSKSQEVIDFLRDFAKKHSNKK